MHHRRLRSLKASVPRRTGAAAGAPCLSPVHVAPWWLVGMIIACLFVTACGLAHPMLGLLPTRAGGVTFSQAHVIDDTFLSGHAIDDVYAALARSRRDGLAAARLDPASGDEIGAMRVNGVSGEELLDAFVQHWHSAAVVDRAAGTIGDRSVWTLRHRGGATTVAYRRDDIVFYASSEQDARAPEYVNDLP